MSSHRCRDDGGAVLVEAALVLPVLFLFVFGLLDFSNWEFQGSQGSSAARDGARAGIVLPLATSADRSSAQSQIEAAVRSRILGVEKLPNFTIQAYCSNAAGLTTMATSCTTAVAGSTQIIVTVSWKYRPISFVGATFGQPTISSTAQMVWQGAPVNGGVAPPAAVCQVTGIAVNPPKPTVGIDGKLTGDLSFGLQTNGAGDCPTMTATLTDANGLSLGTPTVSATGTTGTATLKATNAAPAAADRPYSLTLFIGTRIVSVFDFTLDSTPAQCAVTQIAPATPLPSVKNGGSGQLNRDLAATFTASGPCAGQTGTAEIVLMGTNDTVIQAVPSVLLTDGTVTFDAKPKTGNYVANRTYVVRLMYGTPQQTVTSSTFTISG